MATNDIRFNQIGGGCGTKGGLYTAYAPDKNQPDLEGKDFMGDWSDSIPDGSWVFVITGANSNGDGLYQTYNDGQMKKYVPPEDK